MIQNSYTARGNATEPSLLPEKENCVEGGTEDVVAVPFVEPWEGVGGSD